MSAVASQYKKCRTYLGRTVKIKAKDGNIYIGKIVKLDSKKVYLKVKSIGSWNKARTSLFFPFILPLVLFDLLAITLLF